ncbi:MAG: hypothetical protein E7119_06385 [Bacteroidales bacterium]|nr:hypothetical protein [Bacteroidales bacterium]
MEKSRFSSSGLVELDDRELLMRGGMTWGEFTKLLGVIEKVLKFVGEYEDEIRKGFEKGWRIL